MVSVKLLAGWSGLENRFDVRIFFVNIRIYAIYQILLSIREVIIVLDYIY